MNILEVLALLGFGLACVKFGYELGKNAKKEPPSLQTCGYFLTV